MRKYGKGWIQIRKIDGPKVGWGHNASCDVTYAFFLRAIS